MISITRNNFYLQINYVNNSTEKCSLISNDDRDYSLESFKRSKRIVLDYGYNNYWSHFITLTVDNRKQNINNPNLLLKRIKRQFNNFQQRFDKNFKYILIPELGSVNGRLHFHGVVFLTNTDRLKFLFYDKKFNVPVYRDDWFFKNIGANQFTLINNLTPAVIRYISKYMTKQNVKLFDQLYFCSNGLKKSTYIIEPLENENIENDFYNEFLKTKLSHNTPYATTFELDISYYDKIIQWLQERSVKYEV